MTTSIRNIGLSAALLLGSLAWSPVSYTQDTETATPPEGLPFKYGRGYELFQNNCAECHGANLDGTDQGPPLLHGYYKPGHHSDVAFFRAIEHGSPQHHWNFGDMKPVDGVDEKQAQAIVDFVRWYQQETGLY